MATGVIQTGDTTLAAAAGGIGTLTVNGGTFIAKSLTVGSMATGTLNQSAGQIQCDNLFAGDQSGSTGNVTIGDGNFAFMIVGGNIVMAIRIAGTMAISGTVSALSMELGDSPNSSGTLTVTGNTSILA